MSENHQIKKYKREITSAEQFFMRSPFSIVTMVARIKGNVTGEMLKDAVVKAQQRHALLRVRIKKDGNQHWWFTHEEVQEIPISIVPRTSKDDWISIHKEALRMPFEFETRPAIRFILIHAPDTSELIILCHHLICDGMSLAYLARDMMLYLGNPECKAEALLAPAPITLNNLPDNVKQSGIVKFLINRMNKKWAEERETFDQEDYEILTKAYWEHYTHEILPIELTEEETASLVTRCKKEKVTVTSALTTAFAGAQRSIQDEKPYHAKLFIAANLRDRLPDPAGEGMGMYAGGVELKYRFNHKTSFWENTRTFHKKVLPKYTNKHLFSDVLNWLYLDPGIFEAMNFKKLGTLVSPDADRYEKLSTFSQKQDIVLRLLQRDHLDSMETKRWGTAVTNLGSLDFPKAYGALELERLIMQPGGGIPLANANLVLGVVTCAAKLSLVVEYAAEAIDSASVIKITEKAMAYLLHE